MQENDSIDVFPSQVQYFFEHEVNLPGRKQTHLLAYVKWFSPVQNTQTRFHCQVDDDNKSCNVKIWTDQFYNISRDCIIPVHNIFSRFIPTKFIIGTRKPVTYMAVISIRR